MKDGDVKAMREWLPQVKMVSLPKAGHNVHVDDRKGFLDALNKWLQGSGSVKTAKSNRPKPAEPKSGRDAG